MLTNIVSCRLAETISTNRATAHRTLLYSLFGVGILEENQYNIDSNYHASRIQIKFTLYILAGEELKISFSLFIQCVRCIRGAVYTLQCVMRQRCIVIIIEKANAHGSV